MWSDLISSRCRWTNRKLVLGTGQHAHMTAKISWETNQIFRLRSAERRTFWSKREPAVRRLLSHWYVQILQSVPHMKPFCTPPMASAMHMKGLCLGPRLSANATTQVVVRIGHWKIQIAGHDGHPAYGKSNVQSFAHPIVLAMVELGMCVIQLSEKF